MERDIPNGPIPFLAQGSTSSAREQCAGEQLRLGRPFLQCLLDLADVHRVQRLLSAEIRGNRAFLVSALLGFLPRPGSSSILVFEARNTFKLLQNGSDVQEGSLRLQILLGAIGHGKLERVRKSERLH